ncbi:hypothetical protein DSECCO2_654710 [anaerobic digester metagenome]
MSRFFVVCRREAGNSLARNHWLVGERKLRGEGLETHHPTNGIAAINNRTGAKQYLCLPDGKGVKVNDILQVAAPENCSIHAYSIHRI